MGLVSLHMDLAISWARVLHGVYREGKGSNLEDTKTFTPQQGHTCLIHTSSRSRYDETLLRLRNPPGRDSILLPCSCAFITNSQVTPPPTFPPFLPHPLPGRRAKKIPPNHGTRCGAETNGRGGTRVAAPVVPLTSLRVLGQYLGQGHDSRTRGRSKREPRQFADAYERCGTGGQAARSQKHGRGPRGAHRTRRSPLPRAQPPFAKIFQKFSVAPGGFDFSAGGAAKTAGEFVRARETR